ncbi:hypothetical protein [Nocardia wallacei]|uniref:hypothetical protein n=1 Tax=Nocardia wallacei TaxID=480035 RepID=UPI002457FF57|nr:hypothetical protein [Nocardia wallacei]
MPKHSTVSPKKHSSRRPNCASPSVSGRRGVRGLGDDGGGVDDRLNPDEQQGQRDQDQNEAAGDARGGTAGRESVEDMRRQC